MPDIGFRILPFQDPPAPELVDALRNIATAHLSDNMNRLNAIGPEIRPFHKGGSFAGPALTVKVPPGDNLMVHKAIDMARPGDVIVVDAGGLLSRAIIGEIMSALAERRGAAGMVIDGSVRDAGALARSAFPVYARGVTHLGPYKKGPGEINVPVAIGGSVVMPGEIVVGDEDGLVTVPRAEAAALVEIARKYADHEEALLEAIRAGEPIDRAWVNRTLREKGCAL